MRPSRRAAIGIIGPRSETAAERAADLGVRGTLVKQCVPDGPGRGQCLAMDRSLAGPHGRRSGQYADDEPERRSIIFIDRVWAAVIPLSSDPCHGR